MPSIFFFKQNFEQHTKLSAYNKKFQAYIKEANNAWRMKLIYYATFKQDLINTVANMFELI